MTPPVLSNIPADVTVECGEDLPVIAAPTATDNCDGDLTFTPDVFETTSDDCDMIHVITRTWIVTDACGNAATATQVTTVVDTTNPVITCPSNVTVDCNESTDPSSTGSASAVDACGMTTIEYLDGPTTGDCPMSFVRTWTATDDCGNTSTCDQTISIDDNDAPTFTDVPSDLTLDCSDPVPATDATATDVCSGTVTVTQNDVTAGECPTVITRTFTATDACGNSATATQTITIDDTTAPVLSVASGDITVQCEGDVPAPGTVTATDDCDADVTITFSESNNLEGEEICEISDAIGTNPDYWSVLINGLPAGLTSSWVLDGPSTFVTFADGTAILEGNCCCC